MTNAMTNTYQNAGFTEASATSRAVAALRAVIGLPVIALEALARWQERAAQRQHLMSLSQHMLDDMGLTRADAVAEWSKPMWRV